MKNKTKNVIAISAYIDTSTRIDGNIFSENNLKIDGTVNGDVTSVNDVVVSEKGVVNGDINAKCVVIDGIVRGNINTEDTVTLSSSGTIEGDVQTIGIIADIGSTFKGVCNVIKAEQAKPAEEQVSTYQIPVQEPAPEPEVLPEEPINIPEIEKEPEPSVYKIKVKKEVEKKSEPEIFIEEKSEDDITSELLAEIAAGIEA